MYTTYHLTSAQEINIDLLNGIKTIYKSKPITITVEEDYYDNFELTPELKSILDERLLEDENNYLTAEESLNLLKNRYEI